MKAIYVWKTDFSRWFLKKRFFFVSAGIFILNCLLLLQNMDDLENANVIYIAGIYMEDPFFILNFILAAAVFGTSYCEERKKNYFAFYIKRCNSRSYLFSKIVHCFLSGLTALTLGMMLWIFGLRCVMPWADLKSDVFATYADYGLGVLLRGHHFITYYFVYAMGLGMIAGIISVITFTLSLFIKDQVVVLTLPVIIYYIYNAYLGGFSEKTYYWSLEHIFYFTKSQNPSVGFTFMRGLLYAAMLCAIFGFLSYQKLRRDLNE